MKNKIKESIRIIYSKTQLKKQLLKIFFRKKRNSFTLKKNIQNGVFPIEIISSMGLFANLTFALYIIKYCEEKNLTPYFKFTLENSNIKGNPFDYFFKMRKSKIETTNLRFAKMKSWSDLNMDIDWTKYQKLNIKSAGAIIKNHFIIDQQVQNNINVFFEKELKNKNVLGLHYRATDKQGGEANIVTYDFVITQLEKYLIKYPETELIFVSTDDKNFIKFIETTFFKVPITYYPDSYRSSDKTSIHLSGQNLYNINLDAITNCLLLSKCTRLMKTASILSAWSKLFNPNIPVIILSKPKDRFNFFPEKNVIETSLYEVSHL